MLHSSKISIYKLKILPEGQRVRVGRLRGKCMPQICFVTSSRVKCQKTFESLMNIRHIKCAVYADPFHLISD